MKSWPETMAEKRSRRTREISDAAIRLEQEIERQDICGYRDWLKLVEAVLQDMDFYRVRLGN